MIEFVEAGMDKVIAHLEKMPLKVRMRLESKVRLLAFQFVEKVRSEKLRGQMVKMRTGNLASSVRLAQLNLSETESVAVMAAGGSGSSYASHVEFGTVPHEIRAKYAKALRFEIGGNVLFRKKVNHPGTFPRPFMASTLEEMAPWIVIEMENAVREGLRA